jgi:hypothetical protein
MHSYCTKLFHCKILLCLRKERLHIPTLFVDFLSTPTFLVPTMLPVLTKSLSSTCSMFNSNKPKIPEIISVIKFRFYLLQEINFVINYLVRENNFKLIYWEESQYDHCIFLY